MERERPLREIYYNRTGNLSTTTQLNKEVADEFMRRGDMRRDIIIVDSDKKPEGEAVRVGSDVLAWRGIAPLSVLTAIHFRPKPLHELTRKDEGLQQLWEVAVHEQIIDDFVRKRRPIDRSDYEEQFLQLLNKAVKSGLSQALFQEKLGWDEQKINYLFDLVSIAFLSTCFYLAQERDDFLRFIGLSTYFGIHVGPQITAEILIRLGSLPDRIRTTSSQFFNRDWVWSLFTLVPFEKYLAGRLFLARHGEKLIIPRNV